MRFVRILFIVLMAWVLLSVCTRSDFMKMSDDGLNFGTFIFKRVSHLSPLSSSTPDHLNAVMKETKYTIAPELFKFETRDHTIEITDPCYVREQIKNETKDDSIFSYDIHSTIGNDIKFQYVIYDRNGARTHWRLYISGSRTWIAQYADNTADGLAIMSVCELSKQTEQRQ